MIWKHQLVRPILWDGFPSFWTQLDQQILAKLIHHFLQLYDELNLRLALHGSHKVQHKHKSKSTNTNTNTNTNMYDELDLRAVLWGSHQVTLVTALEKAEIPSHHRLTAVFELLVVSPFSKVHNSRNNNRKLSICLISIWRSSELLVVSAFVCTVCIKPSQGPYYNLFYCGLQHWWIFGKLISLSKSYIANFLFI